MTILKVTLEFDNHIEIAEGIEAEKWLGHCEAVAILAHSHNMNPFDADKIKWTVVKKNNKSEMDE